jgi:hypothetical protein
MSAGSKAVINKLSSYMNSTEGYCVPRKFEDEISLFVDGKASHCN